MAFRHAPSRNSESRNARTHHPWTRNGESAQGRPCSRQEQGQPQWLRRHDVRETCNTTTKIFVAGRVLRIRLTISIWGDSVSKRTLSGEAVLLSVACAAPSADEFADPAEALWSDNPCLAAKKHAVYKSVCPCKGMQMSPVLSSCMLRRASCCY